MREILFRGQTRRKGEKVWMDGSPVDSNWVYGGIFPGEGDFSVIYTLDDIDSYPVYTNTVGQFTGLVDKNGAKIFEGDIIEGVIHSQWNHRLQRCVVEWNNNKAKFECHHYVGKYDYYDYAVKFSKNIEVIGNIYDNPELLGEEI